MNTITKLTREEDEVLEAMRTIVAEKGAGYVYDGPRCDIAGQTSICQYFDGDIPCCIVGHLFARMGWNEPAEGQGARAAMLPYVSSDRLREAVGMAQWTQDKGLTWGAALRRMEQELGVAT